MKYIAMLLYIWEAIKMQLTKNFNSSEFACPCCGQVEMDDQFMTRLQTIRTTLNKPMRITSGFRCIKRNAEVGGSRNSAHLRGQAADFTCVNSRDRFIIISTAIQIGITRIGIGATFLHLDTADETTGHPSSMVWHYYMGG